MTIIYNSPIINCNYTEVAFPNFNGNHIFNLSDYDMLIYYHKLFDNRTSENKFYIDKYSSFKELEEDIYGECVHINNGDWTTKDFRDIYDSLDKQVFFNKLNLLIEKYGNLVSSYTVSPFCIKSDVSVRLLDYLKGLYPNIKIETWSDVYV